MKKTNLIFILFIGLIAISTASLFVRLAQSAGVPSLVIASYRLLIAAAILLIPALKRGSFKALNSLRRSDLGLLAAAACFLAFHFASWITSLEYTSILKAAVFVTTTPLWIALLSPIFLKEKTKRLTMIGMMIAISGGVIIALSGLETGSGEVNRGDLLALFGAVMAAGYFLIGRGVKDRLPLDAYLVIVFGGSGMILFVWSLLSGLQLGGFSYQAMLWVALTGLIPQLLGHSLSNLALRQLSASFVSITWLGEPIGSTLLGILFLHEIPDTLQIVGGIVILGGILVASYAEKA